MKCFKEARVKKTVGWQGKLVRKGIELDSGGLGVITCTINVGNK